MDKARFGARFTAGLEIRREQPVRFLVSSIWEVECFRKGDLLWKEINKNLCTDEGLNALLDIMFHGSTQITTWYVAIYESNTTILSTHTYAVPGYTESSAYGEATRPAFNEGAASSKSITNSSNKAEFTMNDTKTIYGAALVGGGTGGSTKGDTAGGGKLYCASGFSGGGKGVTSGDVLKVTCTLTAADV